MELESKALAAPDAQRELKDAFEDFMNAFDAFKSANDDRLNQLEKRAIDTVTEDKVNRINAALDEQKKALDEIALAAQRPILGPVLSATPATDTREHKSAFERYVRKGDVTGLDRFEIKALSTQSDPDGGYLVPRETEAAID